MIGNVSIDLDLLDSVEFIMMTKNKEQEIKNMEEVVEDFGFPLGLDGARKYVDMLVEAGGL